MLSTLINKVTDAMDAVQSIRNRTSPLGSFFLIEGGVIRNRAAGKRPREVHSVY